jgi:hypothetical protein
LALQKTSPALLLSAKLNYLEGITKNKEECSAMMELVRSTIKSAVDLNPDDWKTLYAASKLFERNSRFEINNLEVSLEMLKKSGELLNRAIEKREGNVRYL